MKAEAGGLLVGKAQTHPKRAVRDFWDASPCGTLGVSPQEGSAEFFQEIERRRYAQEPFIFQTAEFARWKGNRVLEIGCGTGTDLLQFLRAGADAWGLDMSSRSVGLAGKRLDLSGFDAGRVLVGDAENLPFPSGRFDLVYSWGVLHHTPDTTKAVMEVYRALRPGGEICIMLYHRWSLVALQFYLRFGLLRGRPFRRLDEIMATHQESPGTKVYSCSEVKSMFSGFQNIRVSPVVTPYDLRWWSSRPVPGWMLRLTPRSLGYFLVIQGRKPGLA